MSYILFIFKNGSFRTYIIDDYSIDYLEKLFRKRDMVCFTYSIYDKKANRYDRGYVNSLGKIVRINL